MVDNQSKGIVETMVMELQALLAQKDEEIARLSRDYAQLRDAYETVSAGKPLGPVVGAQTIVNQQLEINRLQTELDRVMGELRKRLWLSHGALNDHSYALYGDDGEMQCGMCVRDYKVASLDNIYQWEIEDATRRARQGKEPKL